jgi:hypothetical protein
MPLVLTSSATEPPKWAHRGPRFAAHALVAGDIVEFVLEVQI